MTRQRVQLYQLVAFHPIEAGPLAAFDFANWGTNGIEIFYLLRHLSPLSPFSILILNASSMYLVMFPLAHLSSVSRTVMGTRGIVALTSHACMNPIRIDRIDQTSGKVNSPANGAVIPLSNFLKSR